MTGRSFKIGESVTLNMPSGRAHRRGDDETYITIAHGAKGVVVGHAGTHAVVVFAAIGGTIGVNLPTQWLRGEHDPHSARPVIDVM